MSAEGRGGDRLSIAGLMLWKCVPRPQRRFSIASEGSGGPEAADGQAPIPPASPTVRALPSRRRLASALDPYIEGFSARSGIRISLEISPEVGRLPQELETTLFRVVQESLTNMHRHSDTSTGEIRTRVIAGELVLEVDDHGKGMAPPTLDKLRRDGPWIGVGMSGMRERMRQVGGRIEVESGRPGTTIRALLRSYRNPYERRNAIRCSTSTSMSSLRAR